MERKREKMKNKELVAIVIYLIVMLGTGFGFGCMLVREEYDKLKDDYNVLEIKYKKDLDDCYQQIGDMQDDYDVNNDGLINAVDYVLIKNYIMNRDEECYVNGGWNCE
jgi:hypothetical protein